MDCNESFFLINTSWKTQVGIFFCHAFLRMWVGRWQRRQENLCGCYGGVKQPLFSKPGRVLKPILSWAALQKPRIPHCFSAPGNPGVHLQ